MKLIIHSVGVWGVPNIRVWTPENPKIINEIVEIYIGAKSLKGSDIFTIRVATPAGLELTESTSGILAARPLVMKEYDYEYLWGWLVETVKSCEAGTWSDCVANLQRYFDWEYDGYRED